MTIFEFEIKVILPNWTGKEPDEAPELEELMTFVGSPAHGLNGVDFNYPPPIPLAVDQPFVWDGKIYTIMSIGHEAKDEKWITSVYVRKETAGTSQERERPEDSRGERVFHC